jgi:hypothetical protein
VNQYPLPPLARHTAGEEGGGDVVDYRLSKYQRERLEENERTNAPLGFFLAFGVPVLVILALMWLLG